MNKIAIPLMLLFFVFPLTTFSQWYVGATAGQYDPDEPDWETSATVSTRGGYKFNEVFSIEASYVFFSETELNNYPYYTLEGGLFDVGLVGTIPLSKKFEIFGRIGYGYWAADVNGYGYNTDDTGDSFNYGGGLAFNINKNFSVFAGYQKYDFDIDYGGDFKVDTVYAGLKFFFDFDKGSKPTSTSNAAATQQPKPPPQSTPQLRAVNEVEKSSCRFIQTVTTGSGGPGEPSVHTENAMRKALASAANVGADSYYVVEMETTGTGASVILEALNCN